MKKIIFLRKNSKNPHYQGYKQEKCRKILLFGFGKLFRSWFYCIQDWLIRPVWSDGSTQVFLMENLGKSFKFRDLLYGIHSERIFSSGEDLWWQNPVDWYNSTFVSKQSLYLKDNLMENHRWSKIKRRRKSGFRKRMETKNGRKTLSRKRHVGRTVNTAWTMLWNILFHWFYAGLTIVKSGGISFVQKYQLLNHPLEFMGSGGQSLPWACRRDSRATNRYYLDKKASYISQSKAILLIIKNSLKNRIFCVTNLHVLCLFIIDRAPSLTSQLTCGVFSGSTFDKYN